MVPDRPTVFDGVRPSMICGVRFEKEVVVDVSFVWWLEFQDRPRIDYMHAPFWIYLST